MTKNVQSRDKIDVLIVPGGVMQEPLENPVTLDWVRWRVHQARLVASICTGAFLLAHIGLLDGLSATTHWEDIPEMRRLFPKVQVVDGASYVDEGSIVTSAGISAGIDMSLHLVRRLGGLMLAQSTARQMQYAWEPNQGQSAIRSTPLEHKLLWVFWSG